MTRAFLAISMVLLGVACDESGPVAAAGSDAGADADVDLSEEGVGVELDVSADTKTYVSLESATVVPGDGTGWDLAFQGYHVFTNSGPSGPGAAAAFGPLDEAAFLLDVPPTGLPPLAQDKTGGAFLGWYYYDGSTHYLWSRFHTFGVKDGERLWKVQLITYYGERNGGPVSALYKLRYAELGAAGPGPTKTITLDGTAGGGNAPASAPTGCFDLATGTALQLTVAEAATSTSWHLCARRDVVSVNGGVSGPRGAVSVDLDDAKSATETLDAIKTRSEASETAAFDAVTSSSFAGATFLPDGVVSAFRDLWVDRTSSPPKRGDGAWLVQSATSGQLYLVAFPEFREATAETPNHVTVRIKKVGGTTP